MMLPCDDWPFEPENPHIPNGAYSTPRKANWLPTLIASWVSAQSGVLGYSVKANGSTSYPASTTCDCRIVNGTIRLLLLELNEIWPLATNVMPFRSRPLVS